MPIDKGECFFLDVNYNFAEYVFISHVVTSILNSISSIMAVSGNAVVILAVWKTPALHTPSNVSFFVVWRSVISPCWLHCTAMFCDPQDWRACPKLQYVLHHKVTDRIVGINNCRRFHLYIDGYCDWKVHRFTYTPPLPRNCDYNPHTTHFCVNMDFSNFPGHFQVLDRKRRCL